MTYRILALDGGGPWALLEAMALQRVFGDDHAAGHAVLGGFDMVAANSGGAIVLAGLVEGKTLAQIVDMFADEGVRRSMFVELPCYKRASRIVNVGPQYSGADKLRGLIAALPESGNTRLDEVAQPLAGASGKPVHLLITSFDYDRRRAVFFRSAPTGSPEWGDGAASAATLAQAAHASSEAPVNFFDAPAAFPGTTHRYWDGGVAGCNNPVLAAVTEAVTLGIDPREIRALSIGTGNVVLPVGAADNTDPLKKAPARSCMIKDIAMLGAAILDDPPDAATFVAHAFTGGGAGVPAGVCSRVIRLNPLIAPFADGNGGWRAPLGMSAAEFRELADIPMDALQQDEIVQIRNLGGMWIGGVMANQPHRMDGATFACELGYGTFGAAKDAWLNIRDV